MENILENALLSTAYTVVTFLLSSLGMYKILTKCNVKGYWGFIPGLRYYRMSEIAGREVDGLCVIGLGAIAQLSRYWINSHPDDTQNGFVLAIVTLAILMAVIVYELRVVSGMTRVFGLKKRWIFFWALMPWLTALIWGFSRNIQPVNMDLLEQEAMMAGSTPASLAEGALKAADRDHGLYVNVKDRRVRSSGKRRYLLKDIVFSLPNGSMTLVLGGSGAGKTTLINAILGYEKAHAEIRLNGKDVYKNYSEMKYKIGFVPQQDLLRYNDTVKDTLKDAAKLRLPVSMHAKEREQRVQEVMDILGLSAGKDGLVSKKSGGMRKRISIGTALISDPDLFVLDEPDSGLDGVIARELFEKLRAVADSGKIVLVITHTPDRVIDMFDHVVVLARDSGRVGRLAYCGTVEDAYTFFEADSMEHIVRIVNAKTEGGEGRADEMISKFIQQQTESEAA